MLTQVDRMLQATRGNTHRRPPRIDRDPPRITPGRMELHMPAQIDRLIKASRETTHRRPPWIDRDPPRKTPGRKVEVTRARRPHIPALAHNDHIITHAPCDVTRVRRAELATNFAAAVPPGLLQATTSSLLQRKERSCDHGTNELTHFGPVRTRTHSIVQKRAGARPPPRAARKGGDPTRFLVRAKGNPLDRQNRAAPEKLGTAKGGKGPTRHTNRAAGAPTPAQHTCSTQQKSQHHPLDARSHQAAWQCTMTA